MKRQSPYPPALSIAVALTSSASLAFATYSASGCPRLHFAIAHQRVEAKPTGSQDAGSRDGAADRKLLDDLETALDARADHFDASRVDRELAAAFRAFGLDLDAVDAKAAGARLAGHPRAPEIAAAIDEWCRLRKWRLNLSTWRKLGLVARAADHDPWRNAVRDQVERPADQSRAVLQVQAADHNELERQPVRTLLLGPD